jgi:ubiquinone/menaquinone biosynthesis C-methylase UbiE
VISNPRTAAIASIIASRIERPPATILVVGCGSGVEAAVLATKFGARVTGIDIVERFDPEAATVVTLQHGDATSLTFADEAFDVVYSYHALEHIPDYRRALSEMRRLLKPWGCYCVGTPNRARIVGYIGGGSTMTEKIRWNMADRCARLQGKFRNEYGAHAGFTAAELRDILLDSFATAENVTAEYYRQLYANHRRMVDFAVRAKLADCLFPSVYFLGARAH